MLVLQQTELDPVTACLLWRGRLHGRYGQLNYHGRRYLAHRFSLLAFRMDDVLGVLQQLHDAHAELDGLVVMHTCDRPRCVNPWHLQVGTQADNVADMIAKGRASWQAEDIEWLAAAMLEDTSRYARPYAHG